jgi:HSP20 family protein
MNMRDIIPWSRNNGPTVRYPENEVSPFLSLHREMNRLFDDMFRRFDMPEQFGRTASIGATWPRLEVSDGDGAMQVTAEVPGMEEKDIEVLLENGALILRGERTSNSSDPSRQFSERFYGRFERRLSVPDEITEDKVTANFRNGVLTIVLPKTEKAQARSKRIAINSTN